MENYYLLNRIEVSEDIKSKIEAFIDLVLEWNQKINITAHQTHQEILLKDILDYLFLFRYLEGTKIEFKRGADLGAGAGFGGILLSLLIPEKEWVLVESNRKKSSFIKQALRELNLKNAAVEQKRMEEIDWKANPFDFLMMRAVMSPLEFSEKCLSYLAEHGYGVFLGSDKQEAHLKDKNYQKIEEFFYIIEPSHLSHKFIVYKK